jgi:capsid portal protein
MEPIENGIQEGSFKEYRKQNRDDILVAHQVPLSKLGGGDSSNIAAALAQDRTFKEQVSRPAQDKLNKMINKIIREKTDILDFKFNELTLTDEIAQSQIIERYIKSQVMLPNEARTILGMPQREGGDEIFSVKPEQENNPAERERDKERTNNQSDGSATLSGRNPKGEGRSSQ